MNIGDCIVCVPPHVQGRITHPDCEFGFITGFTQDGSAAFCRYFRSIPNATTVLGLYEELRTKANSEATPKDFIRPLDYMVDDKGLIIKLIKELGYEVTDT